MEALTREYAERWAPDGISVIDAAAGHFATESLRKYPGPISARASEGVPLKRLGREEEHAWLVALLASPLCRALSGSTVTLDGARDNWYRPWPPPGLFDADDVPTEERR